MKVTSLLIAFVLILAAVPAVADPPAESGPYVVRYDFSGWVSLFYDDGEYLVLYGLDIVDTCQTGVPQFATWYAMDIHNPSDADLVQGLFRGDDVYTSVWMNYPYDYVDCGWFLTNTPVATGTSDMMNVDNDIYAFLVDHQRANTWKWSAHGVLTDVDGNPMRFSSHVHCLWPDWDVDARCKSKINLH